MNVKLQDTATDSLGSRKSPCRTGSSLSEEHAYPVYIYSTGKINKYNNSEKNRRLPI
jgi:hypothetical protein